MFFPLSILRVRIVRDGRRKRNVLVPVILLWLLAGLVALLILPLMLIVAIFRPRAVWMMFKTTGHLAVLFNKTHGLHVEINNARDNILIYHK